MQVTVITDTHTGLAAIDAMGTAWAPVTPRRRV